MDKLDKLNNQISALKAGERLVIKGLNDNVYHQAFDDVNSIKAIGSTDMSTFIGAPAKFKYSLSKLVETETPTHFLVGSAAHCLLLEEDTFLDRYAVMAEGIKQRRGKAWDEFKEKYKGKEILSLKDYALAKKIANSTRDSHSQFFTNGEAETSYFYRDEQTGLLLKARIDYKIDDIAIDFKTTKSADPNAFKKAIFNLYYYIQAAHYLHVCGLSMFCFIATEKEAPFLSSGPHMLSDDVLKFGELQRQTELLKLADCHKNDSWPGYQDGLIICELPSYLAPAFEELETNTQQFGAA